MANITSYKEVESLASNDLFIISDVSKNNSTKSVKLSTLSTYIGLSGKTGTVKSVTGTGNVSGITLSGNVTESGSLTLGGSLSLTSQQVIDFLGYTPSSFDGDYNNLTNQPTIQVPAIYSALGTPSLNAEITAEEIRTLIGVDGNSSNFVKNNSDTFTDSDKVTQIVTLSQAEYDGLVSAGTIDANTLYIIV